MEDLSIAIIQTEGIGSKRYSSDYLLNSIYNASAALSNTYVFSNYVNTPILSSSGLNTLTAPIAFAYGASGIGIGSFFNSANTMIDMMLRIKDIVCIIHEYNSVNFELANYFLRALEFDMQSNKIIQNIKS